MAKPAAKAASSRKEHTRLAVQVRPEQVQKLVTEAKRRRQPGQIRADVSAVVRDALDAWLARRSR